MRQLTDNAKRAACALLLTVSLSGCATSSYWKWAMSQDDSPSTYSYAAPTYTSSTSSTGALTQSVSYRSSTAQSSKQAFAIFLGLFVSPFSLAFDVVTLPIQVATKQPPYGKKKK